MSTSALESQGTLLSVGDAASPEAFTAIPEITDVDGLGGGESAVIDVTDLDSTAKEKRAGIPDEGQLSVNMRWLPKNAVHQGLLADRTNRTLRSFRATFTDSPVTTVDFVGVILSINRSWGIDDVLQAAMTIEITGALTETP